MEDRRNSNSSRGEDRALRLDELDQRIIQELRQDGRQANTEIARKLGVSESTVRNRIRRLVRSEVIEIAALADLRRLGYTTSVLVGIETPPAAVREVASALASLSQVRWVAVLSGRFSIMIAVSFRNSEELFEFLTERLATIPNITRVETFQILRAVRRDYDTYTFGTHA
ncbi:MAG: Lrp/AsnC family transcriptional regulator [Chloroflexi bacterium]|nr:Lrp/AsnC family transcriptional regulator [Chloroflexota bacterium]